MQSNKLESFVQTCQITVENMAQQKAQVKARECLVRLMAALPEVVNSQCEVCTRAGHKKRNCWVDARLNQAVDSRNVFVWRVVQEINRKSKKILKIDARVSKQVDR